MSQPKAQICRDEPVCPWCEAVHRGFDMEPGEQQCQQCGKPFEMDRIMLPTYDTKPMARCSVCDRLEPLQRDGAIRFHYVPGQYEPCAGGKQAPAAEK